MKKLAYFFMSQIEHEMT